MEDSQVKVKRYRCIEKELAKEVKYTERERETGRES